MRELVATLALAALALAVATGCVADAKRAEIPQGADEGERREAILAAAWGPESPETLAAYLDLRREIKPRFDKHRDALTQYARREAGSAPLIGPALMGATLLRRELDEGLEARELDFDDYIRLTTLVYGRWLRAERGGKTPEDRVLRTLLEMEAGLSRRLERGVYQNERERRALEDRLAAVRYQARFMTPFTDMAPEAVLAAIDPETRTWLEEHREEIEELDFGLFDTMAPARDTSGPEGEAAPA